MKQPKRNVQALGNQLRSMKRCFDLSLEEGILDEGTIRRFAALQSLSAVSDFVRSIPEYDGEALNFALHYTIGALLDIQAGATLPSWLVNVPAGRPPLSQSVRFHRASCALAMEIMMKDARPKRRKEDAAKFVFRSLPDDIRLLLAGEPKRGGFTWKTVAIWRDEVRVSLQSSEQSRLFYWIADPELRAETILRATIDTLRASG